jgi:hypothetical protein
VPYTCPTSIPEMIVMLLCMICGASVPTQAFNLEFQGGNQQVNMTSNTEQGALQCIIQTAGANKACAHLLASIAGLPQACTPTGWARLALTVVSCISAADHDDDDR